MKHNSKNFQRTRSNLSTTISTNGCDSCLHNSWNKRPPIDASLPHPRAESTIRGTTMSINSLAHQVSNSLDLSASPDQSYLEHYGTSPQHGRRSRRQTGASYARELKPFNTEDIKILLLENINKAGEDILKAEGYQVESVKSSLPEDELIARIK